MTLRTLQALPRSLALGLLLSVSSAAYAEVPVPTAKHAAKVYYEQGVSAYKAGRLREAIQRFLAADQLAPSPALSFNVARAYERLGESARALEFYRDYVRRGPDVPTVDSVKKRVVLLESELAKKGVQQLTVRSQPAGARVTIDGALRGTTPWTGELVPGAHRIVVANDSHLTQELHVELPATKAIDVSVTLSPALRGTTTDVAPDAPERPVPRDIAQNTTNPHTEMNEARFGAWPWVTLGAGGAALIGAAVFESLRRDAESDARSEPVQPAYHEYKDKMESNQTRARVLLGVGGALSLGGGVLLLLDANRSRENQSHVATSGASLSCGVVSCVGEFRGRF
jgi:hypothetical protein